MCRSQPAHAAHACALVGGAQEVAVCTPAQAHDALITQPHWQVGRRNLDVSAGKTSRLYDGRALRPSGWSPSEEEVDARRRSKSTSRRAPLCCVEHVRRAGRCCTSSVAAAALGMGHMGHGGLGTVLGWLVGWCGGALGSKYILSRRMKYKMYFEKFAYEPNVSEV